MNTQRISAIFEKDLKDFMKNMMLLMMPIIPIVLAVVYSRLGEGEELPLVVIYIVVGVIFSAVTTSIMMTMMAEENEKKTLRGLMLSPASFLDIIIGKSLVTGLMTLITLVISFSIIGFGPILNIYTIIGLFLLFLFFLFLGIGIGLFSKSIASTSAYMMPVMFLFGFTPMIEFLGLPEGSFGLKLADNFPLMQVMKVSDTGSWLPLGVVTIWVIGAALFTLICFKKTKTDD
ncbi:MULTISPECIES: ABC transporter permease [Bacillaceae]|uniref:ABC transporter permease n=1 Tax=Evansella alkalicola TaxID=745819 RepID=A0ABS6K289_9BACI|nr:MULTISPECIES: ABC transporter permease [Bacillaceae]MBU9724274.1 ABC transporter permease [Bacillus alkalicola]